MNEKYAEILKKALSNKYYNSEELKYNTSCGFMLSNNDLLNYNLFKINNELSLSEFNELPLLSFNSKNIFYYSSKELINSFDNYMELGYDFYKQNSISIINDNYQEILLSQLSSELEGTLKIEGVNTTRKQINDIYTTQNIKDKNDQIIFNMINGLKFIEKKPEFNKENFKKLYNILSEKSLPESDIPKDYYRDDMVYVGNHNGCDVDKINECMNSLFNYVTKVLNKKKIDYESYMLPFIVHYYIVYIHPYFDFNGRTARMAFIWILYLNNMNLNGPIYLSEAINDDKYNYYKEINYTRNSGNDLTYFITYLVKLANKYFIIYKNINYITSELSKNGESLSVNEQYYLKRILINKNKGWFNYRGFLNYCSIDITKQGALKILNKLIALDLLDSKLNSKKEKIFIIKDSIIKYEYND